MLLPRFCANAAPGEVGQRCRDASSGLWNMATLGLHMLWSHGPCITSGISAYRYSPSVWKRSRGGKSHGRLKDPQARSVPSYQAQQSRWISSAPTSCPLCKSVERFANRLHWFVHAAFARSLQRSHTCCMASNGRLVSPGANPGVRSVKFWSWRSWISPGTRISATCLCAKQAFHLQPWRAKNRHVKIIAGLFEGKGHCFSGCNRRWTRGNDDDRWMKEWCETTWLVVWFHDVSCSSSWIIPHPKSLVPRSWWATQWSTPGLASCLPCKILTYLPLLNADKCRHHRRGVELIALFTVG